MLVEIVVNIVLPLFTLMGLGFLADRTFKLDVQTLSRLNFYVFSPAVIFSLAYGSTLSLAEIVGIGGFTVAHMGVLLIAALLLYLLPAFRQNYTILTVGTVFTNNANYGIPLMFLAFGDLGVSTISVIIVVHAIIFFTFGLLFMAGAQGTFKEAVLRVVRYPVLYAIILGFGLRGLGIKIPDALGSVIEYLTAGYVGFALINLGVQLSRCPITGDAVPISAVNMMRYAVSPLLAALIVPFFGFSPELSAAMILQAALPTAVNVYIAASEINRGADLASRLVFWTTLASIVGIPMVLLVLR